MTLFLPKFCPFCGRPTPKEGYCETCKVEFAAYMTKFTCPKCGKMSKVDERGGFCPEYCSHCDINVCPRCYAETEDEPRGVPGSYMMLDKCTKCDWRCCGQCL